MYNRALRSDSEMREFSIKDMNLNAYSSCMVSLGDTKLICTANIENKLPAFLKNKGHGWVTAEYSMIPGSCKSRVKRESALGKQSGRTFEIQRLISRSLRTCLDLYLLGEYQIIIDCDVINADGGTRTASINGGYIVLNQAIKKMIKDGLIKHNPIKHSIGALSAGIVFNRNMIDLNYYEDSNAEVDANFVYSSNYNLVEVQVTAEKSLFNDDFLINIIKTMRPSIKNIFDIQNEYLNKD